MAIKELLDSNCDRVVVQEGESLDVELKIPNMAKVQLTEAQLLTLTLVLYDEATLAVINSRGPTPQDVKDANQGDVATDGTVLMKLGPADNVIVAAGAAVGTLEAHVARFAWTWNDGEARTGIAEYRYRVEKMNTPA